MRQETRQNTKGLAHLLSAAGRTLAILMIALLPVLAVAPPSGAVLPDQKPKFQAAPTPRVTPKVAPTPRVTPRAAPRARVAPSPRASPRMYRSIPTSNCSASCGTQCQLLSCSDLNVSQCQAMRQRCRLSCRSRC